MMDEEALFALVNEAVMYAKGRLETEKELIPFAMVLYDNGNIESIDTDEENYDVRYERLVERLRDKTEKEPALSALAIVAKVEIPEAYSAETSNGIRVHLEERHKTGDKIGARFVYVPYQLVRKSGTDELTAQLHTPIAVSFPPEVFV
jgi:hypothetical protein